MSADNSPIKKAESAIDDFLDLWRRRKLVCITVLLILFLPISYVPYLQFVAIPNLENKVDALTSEKNEAIQKRDKAEIQLAPFLAVADRSFPHTPNNQRLELLVSKIDNAFRYNLPPEKTEGSAALYTAVKFFLDDLGDHGQTTVRWHYRRLAVTASKGLANSITPLLRANTFQSFLKSIGVKVEVMTFSERKKRGTPWPNTGQVLAASNGPLLGPGSVTDLHYVLYPNLELWIDERVLRELERVHFEFKKEYTQIIRDAINATQTNN